MKTRGQLYGADAVRRFLFAGDAIFTLQSPSGGRFTYRIERAERGGAERPYFVRVLNGPDNTRHYRYAGFIRPDRPDVIVQGNKGIDPSAPSVVALAWYLRRVGDPRIAFYHEGRCGCCGRLLTVPESIASGIGPVCAGRTTHAIAA